MKKGRWRADLFKMVREWVSEVVDRLGEGARGSEYMSTWMLTKYWYSPVDEFDVVAFGCRYGPVRLLLRL